MASDNRKLLLAWLREEEREGRSLAKRLEELGGKSAELAPLARFLALKETEERALRAELDREAWFRSFSLRLVTSLFVFGFLALAAFAVAGGDSAFRGALFFIAGAASYYLVAQALATWRGQRDQKKLRTIRERCQKALQELRQEVERG
ncbi:MAG TPA: hypothetical protein VNN18_11015 [Candidatus Xenobia bacterium]|nr:hypothetical protein [Candidatus Xenobia bacterium]